VPIPAILLARLPDPPLELIQYRFDALVIIDEAQNSYYQYFSLWNDFIKPLSLGKVKGGPWAILFSSYGILAPVLLCLLLAREYLFVPLSDNISLYYVLRSEFDQSYSTTDKLLNWNLMILSSDSEMTTARMDKIFHLFEEVCL